MRVPTVVVALAIAAMSPAAARAAGDPTSPATAATPTSTSTSTSTPTSTATATSTPTATATSTPIPDGSPSVLPEANVSAEAANAAADRASDERAAKAAGLRMYGKPAAATAPAAPGSGRGSGLPRYGIMLGAGFPDLVTASFAFRPVKVLRLYAGPSWNYVGWGLQGGAALVPWDFPVAPVLSLSGGRFFGSDLGFVAKDKGGVPAGLKPLLEHVDYSYAALDVGVELGSQRGFTVSLRLGLSYVSIAANGHAAYTSDSGTRIEFRDPKLHGTLPSVKLGFTYWL